MRITEEYIQEKIAAGKIKDFTEGAERSQLRRFIRQNKLSEKNVSALWNIVDMQWELAKYQKLSVSLIKSTIDSIAENEGATQDVTLREILLNQEISDDIVKLIDEKLYDTGNYLMAWEAKPLEFYRAGNFEKFLQIIDGVGFKYKNLPKLNKAFIAVAVNIPETVFKIVEKSFRVTQTTGTDLPSTILQNMIRRVYFEDDVMDFMRDNFEELFFMSMMEKAVVYKTCSEHQRARFLLEK
jgi:hypothetical protein